jgi:hypothetical protein
MCYSCTSAHGIYEIKGSEGKKVPKVKSKPTWKTATKKAWSS